MTGAGPRVAQIVQAAPVSDGGAIVTALCPYCGRPHVYRVDLGSAAAAVQTARCRGEEVRLEVHPELAAGKHWEAGDPDADDEADRAPRWSR